MILLTVIEKEDTNGSRDSHKTLEEDSQSHDCHMTPEDDNHLSRLFDAEIAAAKGRLEERVINPAHVASNALEATPTSLTQFRSHRSGVDSFMTGFAFTCYALQAMRDGGDGNHDNRRDQLLLSGLSEVRNCLASRRRGQHHLPITIFKSKYAKNSSSLLGNHERLVTIATVPNKLYSKISGCN